MNTKMAHYLPKIKEFTKITYETRINHLQLPPKARASCFCYRDRTSQQNQQKQHTSHLLTGAKSTKKQVCLEQASPTTTSTSSTEIGPKVHRRI